jgi:hypothetical protein
MKYILIFALLSLALCPLRAQGEFKVIGEADSKWPGIRYQIYSIQRYPPNHLLLGVRLLASPQAPAGGTFIGFPMPIPPNATKDDIASGKYDALPLSMASSIMVDELTKTSYSPVTGVPPPGHTFFPTEAVTTLTPGQAVVLSVQFVVPPPPPPPENGQPPVKQTLSFLFTNAKGPIKNIPIPPLTPPSPPSQ